MIYNSNIKINIRMERNVENTQKLIKFYTLYEPISYGSYYPVYKRDITEDYVWNKFNEGRNWKNRYLKNGIFTYLNDEGTIKDFIQGEYMLDPIFEPYHGRDYSFLKPYPKNIRELLLKQIILDTRHKYDDITESISSILQATGSKIPHSKNLNNELREELPNLIDTLDEFILVLEFFTDPPTR